MKKQSKILFSSIGAIGTLSIVATSLGIGISSNFEQTEKLNLNNEVSLLSNNGNNFLDNLTIESDFNSFATSNIRQLALGDELIENEAFLPKIDTKIDLNGELKYFQREKGCAWVSVNLGSSSKLFSETNNLLYFNSNFNIANEIVKIFKEEINRLKNEINVQSIVETIKKTGLIYNLPTPEKDSLINYGPNFANDNGVCEQIMVNNISQNWTDDLFDVNSNTFGHKLYVLDSGDSDFVTYWKTSSLTCFNAESGADYESFEVINPKYPLIYEPSCLEGLNQKPLQIGDYNFETELGNFDISENLQTRIENISNSKYKMDSILYKWENVKQTYDNSYKTNYGGSTQKQIKIFDNSFDQQNDFNSYFENGVTPSLPNLDYQRDYEIDTPILDFGRTSVGRGVNLYLDLSDLITIDTTQTSGVNTNNNSIWINNAPKVQFGWNGELLWALKQKAQIANKLYELITSISTGGKNLNNFIKYQNTRDSIERLIDDVYNEKIGLDTLTTKINEFNNNGYMDYFYSSNQAHTSPEAQILNKYGWDLLDENPSWNSCISQLSSFTTGFDSGRNATLTNELNKLLEWQLPYEYILPQTFSNDIYVDYTLKMDTQETLVSQKIYDGSKKKWTAINLKPLTGASGDDFNNNASISISNIKMVNPSSNNLVANNNSTTNNTLSLNNILDTSKFWQGNKFVNSDQNKQTTALIDCEVSGSGTNEKMVFNFQYNPQMVYDNGNVVQTATTRSITKFSDNLLVSDYYTNMEQTGGLDPKYREEIIAALHVPTNSLANFKASIKESSSYKDPSSDRKSDQAKYIEYQTLSNQYGAAWSRVKDYVFSEQELKDFLAKWKQINNLGYFYTTITMFDAPGKMNIDYFMRPETYQTLLDDGSIIKYDDHNYAVQIDAGGKVLESENLSDYVTVGTPVQYTKNLSEIKRLNNETNALKTTFETLSSDINLATTTFNQIMDEYAKLQKSINTILNNLNNSYASKDSLNEIKNQILEKIESFTASIDSQKEFLNSVVENLKNLETEREVILSNLQNVSAVDYNTDISIKFNISKMFSDSGMESIKSLDMLDGSAIGSNKISYYFALTPEEMANKLNEMILEKYGVDANLNKEALTFEYSYDSETPESTLNNYYENNGEVYTAKWTYTLDSNHQLSSLVLNLNINDVIQNNTRSFDYLSNKNQVINETKSTYSSAIQNIQNLGNAINAKLENFNKYMSSITDGKIVSDEQNYNSYQNILDEFNNVSDANETLRLERWKTLNNLGYFYVETTVNGYNFALKITNNFKVLDIDNLEKYLDAQLMQPKQTLVEQSEIDLYNEKATRFYKNLSNIQNQLVVLRKTLDKIGGTYFEQLQDSINDRINELLSQYPELQAKVDVIVEQYNPQIEKIIKNLEKRFNVFENTDEYKGSSFVQKMDMEFNFAQELEQLKQLSNQKIDSLQNILNADSNVTALKADFEKDINDFNTYINNTLSDIEGIKNGIQTLNNETATLQQQLQAINNLNYECSIDVKFNINAINNDSQSYWFNRMFNFLSTENINYLFGVSKKEFITKLNEIIKKKSNVDVQLTQDVFFNSMNDNQIIKGNRGYTTTWQTNSNGELISLNLNAKYFETTPINEVNASKSKTSDVTPDSLRTKAKQDILQAIQKCNQIISNIKGTLSIADDIVKQGENIKNITNRLSQNFHPELQSAQNILDNIETAKQTYNNGIIVKQGTRLNPIILSVIIIAGLVALGLIVGLGIYISKSRKIKSKNKK